MTKTDLRLYHTCEWCDAKPQGLMELEGGASLLHPRRTSDYQGPPYVEPQRPTSAK
jgi:hypothetical protein